MAHNHESESKEVQSPREAGGEQAAQGRRKGYKLQMEFPKDEFGKAEIRICDLKTGEKLKEAEMKEDGTAQCWMDRPGGYLVEYWSQGKKVYSQPMETSE